MDIHFFANQVKVARRLNTKTTTPLRVSEERWIDTSTLRVSVYIHHYSPPLWGIVIYYHHFLYIYKTVPVICTIWYLRCELENCSFIIYACAFSELQSPQDSGFNSFLKPFSPYGTYWYEIHFICTCAF